MQTSIYPKQSEKEYELGGSNLIVDLNENIVNFTNTFQVNANEDFNYTIASQTDLDSGAPLPFKVSKDKKASGTIRINDNVFQNYFLVLQAGKPVLAKVRTSLIDLGTNTKLHNAVKNSMYDNNNDTTSTLLVDDEKKNMRQQMQKPSFAWGKLLFGIVILVIFVVLMFSSNREKQTVIEFDQLAL